MRFYRKSIGMNLFFIVLLFLFCNVTIDGHTATIDVFEHKATWDDSSVYIGNGMNGNITSCAYSGSSIGLVYRDYSPPDGEQGIFFTIIGEDDQFTIDPIRITKLVNIPFMSSVIKSIGKGAKAFWDGESFIVLAAQGNQLLFNRITPNGKVDAYSVQIFPIDRVTYFNASLDSGIIRILYGVENAQCQYIELSLEGEILHDPVKVLTSGYIRQTFFRDDGFTIITNSEFWEVTQNLLTFNLFDRYGNAQNPPEKILLEGNYIYPSFTWNGVDYGMIFTEDTQSSVLLKSARINGEGVMPSEPTTIAEWPLCRMNDRLALTCSGSEYLAVWLEPSNENIEPSEKPENCKLFTRLLNENLQPISEETGITDMPPDNEGIKCELMDNEFICLINDKKENLTEFDYYAVKAVPLEPTFTPTPPLPTPTPTPQRIIDSLTVSLKVEGQVFLHVQGDQLWLERGRIDKKRKFTQRRMNIKINNDAWSTLWADNLIDPYTGIEPSLPDQEGYYYYLQSRKISGAGNEGLSLILQEPSSDNDFEAIILVTCFSPDISEEQEIILQWSDALIALPQTPYVQVRTKIGFGGQENSTIATNSHLMQACRMFIEPEKAIPLFIECSKSPFIYEKRIYFGEWEFQPDFSEVEDGLAPLQLEFRETNTNYKQWQKFQVVDGVWLFDHGEATGDYTYALVGLYDLNITGVTPRPVMINEWNLY